MHSLNNFGSKHSLIMKFSQFMSSYKRKNLVKKFYKNCGLKTSSRPCFCLQRIKHNFYWKMKYLKQATYIRYVIAKQSKFVQVSMLTSSEFFIQRILFFKTLKGPDTSFIEFSDKKIYFVILHKLAKFHYQTVFTSQVIQLYVFCVSCLGIG